MPLHLAALNGQLECARLLLERGAEKEAKDKVECGAFGASLVAAFRCSERRAAPLQPWPRAPHCCRGLGSSV
jgi:hypothetical protein